MKSYSLLIVDDDKAQAERLATKIEEMCPKQYQMTIVDDANAMENILSQSYDAYFLDIEMPVYDGFTLARNIHHQQSDAIILFLTAHEDYSLHGYEYNCFRFISKLQMDYTLKSALEALKEELYRRNIFINVKDAMNQVHRIPVCSLYSVYTHRGKLILQSEKERYTSALSFQDFLSLYANLPFALPQKGYLVNLKYIRYIEYDEGLIHMDDGNIVKISRRQRKSFYQRYALGIK